MILRRVVMRLKQQEWTAVVIEVAIVVLGVFIGIQVSNWNEDRKEHALEAVYLDRIAGDVRSDVAEIDRNPARVDTQDGGMNRVLRDATGRDLPTGFESARGRVAVEQVPAIADNDPNSPGFALFILTTLDGNRSAYDTVINTGGIGAMRDAAMLRKVQGYYAAVDKALHFEVGLEQNRDKLVDAERRVGISPVEAHDTGELATPSPRTGNCWRPRKTTGSTPTGTSC